MASSHIGIVVPGNRLWVRVPCPPLPAESPADLLPARSSDGRPYAARGARWRSCSTFKTPPSGTASRCCSMTPAPRSPTTAGWASSAATGPARARSCGSSSARRSSTAARIVRHPRLRLGYLRQHDPFQPGESALDFLMRDSGQPDWKCGEVAGDFELKGPLLDRPGQGALRRLADPRQARGPAAPRAQPAAARRADQLPRPADADPARALSAGLPRGLPGRLPRPGLPQRHLRPDARPRPRQAHPPSRPGRRVPRAPAGTAADGRADQRRGARQEAGARGLHRPQPGPGLDRLAGQVEGQAAREARARGDSARRPHRRDPLPRDRSPPRAPPSAAATWRSAIPTTTVATGVAIEIVHGSRAAIVGDNGQGKTTFLRTLVGSLEPLAGDVKWGYGCEIGTYAQHVYTSLDERRTVLEQLERRRRPGHQAAADPRPGRRDALPAVGPRQADPGALRGRAGPALPGRAAPGQRQRARPRRAGQPPRRGDGRGPGRRACSATRAR